MKQHNKLQWNTFFDRHAFFISFCAVFLCGIPYLICFYPGPVQWDGLRQLNYFFGLEPWSNHHPVFSTLLMGIPVSVGRALLDFNFGVFLYTFFQFLFQCLVFALIIQFMRCLKTPLWFRIGALVFFAVFPLWPIYGYTLVKDTSYYLVFALFLIFIMCYTVSEPFRQKKRIFFFLFALSLLLGLLRNNGIYVAALSILVLIIIDRQRKRKLLITFFSCVIVFYLIQALFPFLGIHSGHVREMLSVPIQQTVRYLSIHADELTDDEIALMERIFHDDLENVTAAYKPKISDPVKAKFSPASEDYLPFFQFWITHFFNDPGVYATAFAANYDGYFNPLVRETKDGLGCYEITQSKRLHNDYFQFCMNEDTASARNVLKSLAYAIREIPVIGLLYSCGLYTWIMVGCIVSLFLQKQKRQALAFVPVVLTLFVCCISPVNAYIRYMLPIMVTMPLQIAFAMSFRIANHNPRFFKSATNCT